MKYSDKIYRFEDAEVISDNGHVRQVKHPDGVYVTGPLDDLGFGLVTSWVRKDWLDSDPEVEVKKLADGTVYLIFGKDEEEAL